MHKINRDEAQMLIDTVQSFGGLMLTAVLGEGACGATLDAGMPTASRAARCKTHTLKTLLFTFFQKNKNPLPISFG